MLNQCQNCQRPECNSCQLIQQDQAEFLMIAENCGWNEKHSQTLQLFEENNSEEHSGYFAKEKKASHLNGYLHASEQTESQIKSWISKLEG